MPSEVEPTDVPEPDEANADAALLMSNKALLPLAELHGLSGAAVIDALIIGIDVACRVGNAMYPSHYDKGWHITGSTGMLGAAALHAPTGPVV